MEMKFGELGWDEVSSGSGSFLDLKEGVNTVRVFTKPYVFYVHWYRDSSGATRKIKCATAGCPLCKEGVKVQKRYYLGVLDRGSKSPKIMEATAQVVNGIKELATGKWGDPKKYDVDIKRAPKGTQPLYTVSPDPDRTEFTDEEKTAIKAFMNDTDFMKLCKPATVDEVLEKMGKGPAPKEEEPASTDSDDESFDFNDDDFNI